MRQQTGLTPRQISDWFSNARRRSLRKADQDSVKQSRFVHPASISVPELGETQRWQNMNPFDRWRHSPPDDEPASWSAIERATSQATYPAQNYELAGSASSPYQQRQHTRPYSQTSFESSWSGNSSSSTSALSSDWSGSRKGTRSAEALVHTSRARRRYHGHALRPPKTNYADSQHRPYQCTFCTDRFKTKYDWTRHEASLHLSLEQWVCTATGPIVFDSADELQRCCFCGQSDPSTSHLEGHNYKVCMDKPAAAKTFLRKDHLRQHLRLVHRVQDIQPSMSIWKEQIASVNSRCGFCSERFQLWSARNEHIADHFREGVSMTDWKGDRGLDPMLALLVENAMPPYLIGAESTGFEPFSASRSGVQGSRSMPTSFETLTFQLSEYVHNAIAEGITVNDQSVRKQARLIMFGDDDAWNQTPADNADWMRLFREGLNLNATTSNLATDMRQISLHSDVSPGISAGKGRGNDDGPTCSTQTPLPSAFQALMHDPLKGLPWAWQTPECLAEFSQMMHQCPEQEGPSNVPLSTRSAGGGNISLSQAWSNPEMQQAFLGQYSDAGRCQHYSGTTVVDPCNISKEQLGVPWNDDVLEVPFELEMSDHTTGH